MKKNYHYILIFLGCFLVLLVVPALLIYAQSTNNGKTVEPAISNKMDPDKVSLDKMFGGSDISKSITGSLLRDRIMTAEKDWTLTSSSYYPRVGPGVSSKTSLAYKDKTKDLFINVQEFETEKDAHNWLNGPRSYGAIVPLKNLGDEGVKVYGEMGALILTEYRIGNFLITITTPDEKAAELFANYAAETVKPFALKQ